CPGESAGVAGRRSKRSGIFPRPPAELRSLGKRAGSSLSVPGFTRLHASLGQSRRPRVGAGARALFKQFQRIQRHSGPEARAAGGIGTNAMKRVLMTGDTVGGVWTFTLELAEALGRHGIEVGLAAMGGPPTAAQRSEAAGIPNLQLFE